MAGGEGQKPSIEAVMAKRHQVAREIRPQLDPLVVAIQGERERISTLEPVVKIGQASVRQRTALGNARVNLGIKEGERDVIETPLREADKVLAQRAPEVGRSLLERELDLDELASVVSSK